MNCILDFGDEPADCAVTDGGQRTRKVTGRLTNIAPFVPNNGYAHDQLLVLKYVHHSMATVSVPCSTQQSRNCFADPS